MAASTPRDMPVGTSRGMSRKMPTTDHLGALRALIIGVRETLLLWHFTHPSGLATGTEHPPDAVAVERLVLEDDKQAKTGARLPWPSTFVGVVRLAVDVQLAQHSLRCCLLL